jgi:hypothetical protein
LELVTNFVDRCHKLETKRHLYEAIALLLMSQQKMRSLNKILSDNLYAACC